jgi:hypothetical protein
MRFSRAEPKTCHPDNRSGDHFALNLKGDDKWSDQPNFNAAPN